MKRFLLFSFAIWLSVQLFADIHYTKLFSPNQLYFDSVSDNTAYIRVRYDGLYSFSKLGLPSLPVATFVQEIPSGESVQSVNVIFVDSVDISVPAPIYPQQQEIPTSYEGLTTNFYIDSASYLSDTFLPQSSINYKVNKEKGTAVLVASICPFAYNPRKNIIRMYTEVNVQVQTSPAVQPSLVSGSAAARNMSDYPAMYEYVIITCDSLADSFSCWANWLRHKGYDAGIVSIEDILSNPYITGDEVSEITDDAGKLRQYLKLSYELNDTKYALLGGNSRIMPIRYGKARSTIIPSDLYFSDFDGNWDSDHDGIFGSLTDDVDYGAEIMVGRIPCRNKSDIAHWVKKALLYEINPGLGDYSYLTRAFFTEADQMQNVNQAERIAALFPSYTTTIFREDPDANTYTPTAPFGATIIDEINTQHFNLLSNFNHGGPLGYGTATKGCGEDFLMQKVQHNVVSIDEYDQGPYLLNQTVDEEGNGFDNLTNYNYPSVMYSISCENMPFDAIESSHSDRYNLGEAFLCYSDAGGVAYLGNTRNGYVDESFRLFEEFVNRLEPADNTLSMAENASRVYYSLGTDDYSHWVKLTHNLAGCPQMKLWMNYPLVFNDVQIREGDGTIFVSTNVENARVCVSSSLDAGVSYREVKEGTGPLRFDDVPDHYVIAVTKTNYLPYVKSSDVYIQNETISTTRTISRKYTYAGEHVTCTALRGKAVVDSGGRLDIIDSPEVVLAPGFEVKIGGILNIE